MNRAPWVVFGLIVAGTAAVALRAQAAPEGDEARIAAGEELFAASCANQYCHGAGGQGAMGPRLVGVPMTFDHIRSAIREGRTGTPMVSFRDVLEPDQIDAVSLYVLSISSNGRLRQIPAAPQQRSAAAAMAAFSQQAPEPPPPSTEPVAIGREQGTPSDGLEAFFDSTRLAGCRGCHSVNGSGGPLGPDFAQAQLTATQALDAVSKPRILARAYPPVTVTLTDGTRLTGIRGPETAEELVVYDVGAIPTVRRTFQKEQVAEVQSLERGLFDHTRLGYQRQELLDIAALIASSSVP